MELTSDEVVKDRQIVCTSLFQTDERFVLVFCGRYCLAVLIQVSTDVSRLLAVLQSWFRVLGRRDDAVLDWMGSVYCYRTFGVGGSVVV